MFVATKKQAKEIVVEAAVKTNMPYVTERWLGGMLTNFSTIRKSVKKMLNIEKMLQDGTMDSVTKKGAPDPDPQQGENGKGAWRYQPDGPRTSRTVYGGYQP